ncbi:hypothetical protein EVA_00476, partial [gut metagenome]
CKIICDFCRICAYQFLYLLSLTGNSNRMQFSYFNKELKDCESLYEHLMFTLKNMESRYKMPEALKKQI